MLRESRHHRPGCRREYDGKQRVVKMQSSVASLTSFACYQGYAMLEQIVSGIHTRLYARAYIVADPSQDR